MFKKTGKRSALAALLGAMLLAGCQSTPDVPAGPATQQNLDLQRYMGSWWEQARLPHPKQTQCVSDIRALYEQDGKRLRVTNSCINAQGTQEQAKAAGRLGPDKDPARLQVRFAPAWLSGWPGVWADYWVLKVDDDYQYALVATPSRQYLWVLSREPKADPQRVQALLAYAREQGFNLDSLIMAH